MSNVDAAKAAYQAFTGGDLAALKEAWAPNIDWWSSDEAKPGGQRHGVDDVMRLFLEVPDHWTSFAVEPERFIDAGEYVVVVGTQTSGNAKGTASSRFAQVLKYDKGGKCTSSEFHSDTAKFNKLQG